MSEKVASTVEYNINKLISAEYNPRELTAKQHQDLKDSIMRFGLVDPLIVNTNKERKNILVGGHQRLRIAKELGYKTVACVEVDLNPDQEKELNIRLNKNTGQWDWDALANYFDVGELTEWGFTDDALFGVEDEIKTPEFDTPKASDDDYSAFELIMLHENRIQLNEILAEIKVDYELDKLEDAMMILIIEYRKARNKKRGYK